MSMTKEHYAQLELIYWEQRKPQNNTQITEQISTKNEINISALAKEVSACTACALHQGRTQTVFGTGNEHAELMLIGEAPGFYEDQQGEPFVGPAGQLLTAMLKAIHLNRDEVYIANILKCRPPNNRDPAPEEIAQCTPFLEQQIKLVAPRLILALGRIAARHLLNKTTSLESMRQQQFTYGPQHIPLFVTYHPAYLLRNPQDKRKAWQDLQMVQQHLKKLQGGG
jgi:uracil-DNA glycosylase